MKHVEISVKDCVFNPFQALHNNKVLITAAHDGISNTMTAGWGEFGILWGTPIVSVFIRGQRYTKEFVDASEYFSVSVMPLGCKEQVTYLGRVSGRDEDKIKNSGMTLIEDLEAPYFEEAEMVFILKKKYVREMDTEHYTDDGSLVRRWYSGEKFGPHTEYIGEVVRILCKKQEEEREA